MSEVNTSEWEKRMTERHQKDTEAQQREVLLEAQREEKRVAKLQSDYLKRTGRDRMKP